MPLAARTTRAAIAVAFVAVLLMAGCTPKGPTFVDRGSTYTTATVLAVFDRADTSKLASRPSTDAPALRHNALSGLRARGGKAATAADELTKLLPTDTRAVPVYVELATIGGQPVVIMVEAAGTKTGALDRKRLWVFDQHGNVVLAGSQ